MILPVLTQGRSSQQGVVLIIALIMLAAMTLVGISLLRSIGAGAGIAGNLAFKQGATSVADLGVELARTWLTTTGASSPATLDLDAEENGYYASWQDDFEPLTHDWGHARKLKQADAVGLIGNTAKDEQGNEIRYVVHRLCAKEGPVSPIDNIGQQCASLADSSGRGSKGGISYGSLPGSLDERPYYRITVRVGGPRNTWSFIQVVMY